MPLILLMCGEVNWSEVKIMSGLACNTCGVTILENWCNTFFPFVAFPMCLATNCSWSFVYWVIIVECISYNTNLTSTVVYKKHTQKFWAKTAAYAIKSHFFTTWFSHLYLGLKTALFFMFFKQNSLYFYHIHLIFLYLFTLIVFFG